MSRRKTPPVTKRAYQLHVRAEDDSMQSDPAGELRQILADLLVRMQREGAPEAFWTIRDSNGNDVGRFGPTTMEFLNG